MTDALRTLVSREDLAAIVARLGAELSADYPDGMVIVGILKGSVCFVADLLRELTVNCEVDFLALSSYAEGESRVRILKDLEIDVANKDVVVIEGIVDTGLSARYVISLLESRGTRTVAVCSLLDRHVHRILPVPIRYSGLEVGEDFLVGYGLDYAERFRNLSGIYVPDLAVLESDPDQFCELAYKEIRAYQTPETGSSF